jgi:chromosomal replication initiator protein
MTATWDDILTAIESKVPAATFNRWFRSLSADQSDSNELRLVADDEFDALFIEKNFAELIRLHLERIVGDDVKLRIVHESRKAPASTQSLLGSIPTPPDGQSNPTASPGAPSLAERSGLTMTERILESGLKLQYSFSEFVVGPSNEFAYAATSAVVDSPGRAYNPLFLYGNVGLGKTHLLNAIGIEMLRRDPHCRVVYMTSEAFMNALIDSLKTRHMSAFRDRFRSQVDVLLIDDIQFIAGKEATQQEFFHTFNALHQAGAQIVITSDQYPHEIPDLEERLRSRFQWGLVADIQAPGTETRVAILRQKAENIGLVLRDDVALYLAQNIRSNVRELEGALLRLHAFAGFNRQLINLDLAKTLLRQFLQESNRELNVDTIQKAVCSYYNVKLTQMKGKNRQRVISLPRQVAMYLSKRYTNSSYPVLGEKFGGRDHTTVLAACRKITEHLETDKTLLAAVQHLEKQLTRR